MIFNSFTYIAFLVTAVCLYWLLPRTPRLLMLFAASIIFYGFWRFDFVPLLLVSIIVDYVAAIVIDRSQSAARRRFALIVSLVVNLGLLAFFKYFFFFSENAIGFAHLLGIDVKAPQWQILLPIGISFYTFQSMSYTIDVYRGFIRPCRDFVLFGTYVMFFPQLIAGPILRAREVIWQLDQRPRFDIKDVSAGIERIVGGLFLKVVLADNIAGFVNEGFAGNAAALSAIDVLTLAFLFGFQIYFDFAAYSHIAIGSARLMGIRFPENFHYPYSATSPREFWRRWHISLSSWIRDYLYLPLTGAKVEDRSTGGLASATRPEADGIRAIVALFVTWAIMGLWHGAAWAFVLWGVWHAMLITLYRLTSGITSRLPILLRTYGCWAWTVPMAMIGWIPFRTQSLADTLTMWSTLLNPSQYLRLGLRENYYLVAAIVMVLVLIAPHAERALQRAGRYQPGLTMATRTLALTFAIAVALVYLRPLNQFIYFQF